MEFPWKTKRRLPCHHFLVKENQKKKKKKEEKKKKKNSSLEPCLYSYVQWKASAFACIAYK